MLIQPDGQLQPIVTDPQGNGLNQFLDKLAVNLHERLPRFVQLAVSEELLRTLLGLAAAGLITRA